MGRMLPFVLIAGISAASAATAAPAADLGMLSKLKPGRWSVSIRDEGLARTICIGDPAQLIQLRHAGNNCQRFLVEDGPSRVSVQYTCKRHGYGLTSIRKETDTLVQIESRGIAGGLPFQFSAEARRIGACR